MSKPVLEFTSPPAQSLLFVRKGCGKPRFLPDQVAQLDPIHGCIDAMLPRDHFARVVLSLVELLDVSELEAQYSSLGRHGLHPRRKLAILVYASLTGVHEASKIERLAKTDAAYRFLAGGQSVSATMMRTFRRENGAFYHHAIMQTVLLAAEDDLIDPSDLATDSMRLRADASTKSIRTLARSEERLGELAQVDTATLSDEERSRHEEKVQKHDAAVRTCTEEGRTSLSVTNPAAGLMKFPNGAGLPGHRVTVVAAGVRVRFVIAVLIGSSATDIDLLRPVTEAARQTLVAAGVSGKMQVAGDAGFLGHDDLQFAIDHREDIDVLLHDPPSPRRGKSKRKEGFFSKAEFDFREDGTVHCPAKKPMRGPVGAGPGKVRWRGEDCGSCPLKAQCTNAAAREVIVDAERERLHGAMRRRMSEPGAQERYRRRIATVEPVFSYIEDTMGYQRASSRHAEAVRAEILLKILAYNLYRLHRCAPREVALVQGHFDGRMHTTGVQVVGATELATAWRQ
jgi:transposase